MLSGILKNLSILKKFLFINLIFFMFISIFTLIYINNVQPNLLKGKSSNHIKIIDNTISHFERLKINFIQEDIRKFFFSTKFLFQTIDRVIIFDKALLIIDCSCVFRPVTLLDIFNLFKLFLLKNFLFTSIPLLSISRRRRLLTNNFFFPSFNNFEF